jgi:hypothetical protein
VLAAPTPAPSARSSGLTGWVLYRVYASYAGEEGQPGTPSYYHFIQGGETLPLISQLRPCTKRTNEPVFTAIARPVIEKIVETAPTPAPEPLFQYNNGGGLFPNDDNKYVFSTTAWKPGRLVIVTALAPSFPNTNAQAIVQTPPTDVRYWSFCTNADKTPAPVVQCADDQHTHLFKPAAGTMLPLTTAELFPGTTSPRVVPPHGALQFAYVVSSQADKPKQLDPSVTWLSWFAANDAPPKPGSQAPGMLIERNMLPNYGFINAIQNVPTYGLSAATQLLASLKPQRNPDLNTSPYVQAIAVMQLYYPRAIYCQDSVFEGAYAKDHRLGAAIRACAIAAEKVKVPI